MAFWLEDDVDPWSSQQPEVASQAVYMSQQQEEHFSCDNCGGTDCYHDDATGMDVCSSCFTESQAPSQAEADWEDVVGLAARTAGGQIQQRRVMSKRKRGDTGRQKQPLEELDRSVPFPDTAVCLQGMQRILQKCVHIAVTELFPVPVEPEEVKKKSASMYNSDDEFVKGQSPFDPDEFMTRQRQLKHSVEKTVKELWLSYLRAWADGAEFYGAKHPHLRFSFRDNFLEVSHVSKLVRRHLLYRVGNETAASETNPNEELIDGRPPAPCAQEHALDESNSEEEGSTATEEDSLPDKDVTTERQKIGSGGRSIYTNKIRLQAIREVIRAYTSRRRKGYKEAALYLCPSMTMVAALVWLALTKHEQASKQITVVTSHDFCSWIATGKLPLMAAFQYLLSRRLRHRLEPVATFFRMEKPPTPLELETMATNLCVACRLLINPQQIQDDEDESSTENDFEKFENDRESALVAKRLKEAVRFWPVSSLPWIIAHLVANAGLDQAVLNRTLIMAGFSLVDPSKAKSKKVRDASMLHAVNDPLTVSTALTPELSGKLPLMVRAELLSCIEEVLGLIAISCQLDPVWRTWTYSRVQDAPLVVPWNESQFRLLSNGPALNSYLDFVEQHVYPDGDKDAIDDNNNLVSMLPKEYFDAGSLDDEKNLYSGPITAMKNYNIDMVECQVEATVRPCSLISGGQAPTKVEATNLTHRRPRDKIGEWHRRGRPAKFGQANTKARRRNRELDEMLLLPFHDFRHMDRAASDWIPDNCPDADQDRLIQFLAYSTNSDPESVRRCMTLLLKQRKL